MSEGKLSAGGWQFRPAGFRASGRRDRIAHPGSAWNDHALEVIDPQLPIESIGRRTVTKRTKRAEIHRLQTVFSGDNAPLTADSNGRDKNDDCSPSPNGKTAARHVAASLRDARRVSERRDHVQG